VQCGNVFVGNGQYCHNCNDDIICKFVEHDHVGDHEQPYCGNIEVVDFKKFSTMGRNNEFEFVGLL
jgi:hypothetical protein